MLDSGVSSAVRHHIFSIDLFPRAFFSVGCGLWRGVGLCVLASEFLVVLAEHPAILFEAIQRAHRFLETFQRLQEEARTRCRNVRGLTGHKKAQRWLLNLSSKLLSGGI